MDTPWLNDYPMIEPFVALRLARADPANMLLCRMVAVTCTAVNRLQAWRRPNSKPAATPSICRTALQSGTTTPLRIAIYWHFEKISHSLTRDWRTFCSEWTQGRAESFGRNWKRRSTHMLVSATPMTRIRRRLRGLTWRRWLRRPSMTTWRGQRFTGSSSSGDGYLSPSVNDSLRCSRWSLPKRRCCSFDLSRRR